MEKYEEIGGKKFKVLNLTEMSHVRGGDGGETIIIPTPPPPPPPPLPGGGG